MSATYYITTPIYYPNSTPHIGSVYTTICADVLARFLRLDGKEVQLTTGTDEHGQKIAESAEKQGLSPQKFVDTIVTQFEEILPLYTIQEDDFIRTTEPRHKKAVECLWRTLFNNGSIYLGEYSGWYSVRDEAYYAESEVADGKAPTGSPVEWMSEPSYFFKLSAFQDKLLAFYESHPDFIAPQSRRNEVISFVKSGLKDLSVSRTSFSWGIPVPGDPKHIVYVWLDALTNYLTSVGYPDVTGKHFQKFWPASLHIVGKDILRFHAVYWPAFLMAADLPLPHHVFAHGWWTTKGEKISKSVGNVIDPYILADRYGVDAIRHYLLREIPFGNDGDFSEEGLITRTNSHLANELGNLVQRTLSMVNKNCHQEIPSSLSPTQEDQALLNQAKDLLDIIRPLLESAPAFHKYIEAVWNVINSANRYIDDQAPWALRKTDLPRMNQVLYTAMECLRYVGILLQPLTPTSADRLLHQIGCPPNQRTFAALSPAHALKSGTPLPPPEGIFPRIEVTSAHDTHGRSHVR